MTGRSFWRPPIPLHAALAASHLGLFLLPGLLLFGSGALARDDTRQREGEVLREAQVVAALVDARLGARAADPAAWAEVEPALADLVARTGVGVRLVDPAHGVRVEVGPAPDAGLAREPEDTALGGRAAVSTQWAGAAEGGRSWTFAAAPFPAAGPTAGAVVIVLPNRRGAEVLAALVGEAGWPALSIGGAALAFSFWASWRVSRSLRALAAITQHVDERGPSGEHARWLLDSVLGTRIAEVRQVAAAFQGTLRRLRDRLRDNEEFAANVSHEFRTPLTTLRGTMDVLMDDADMPAEQRRRFLENARTDLDRLLRMVQGLFDLARVESTSRRQRVELDELAADLQHRFPEVVVSGRGGSVEADGAQLELAVANLIENARLHGGPPIRLHVWAEGERTGVDVEDGGPGISAANLPQVFDRFFTTGRGRKGTGLGLAIVRAVARAHEGDVEVQSRPGATTFRLWVPRR